MQYQSTGIQNELRQLPSATTSVVFFLIITIIYGFIMIYNVINSATLAQVIINSSNEIYTLIYVIFLVSGTYFINVNISKSICNENTIQWGTVFTITMIPWIIVFGILYLLLELFPGWIKPFSNTVGYLVVNMLGATDTLKNVLKTSSTEESDSTIKKALENIEKNYSRFINEIDPVEVEYKKFIKQLTRESLTKSDKISRDDLELFRNNDIVQLFALINVKDIIGKLFWYVLAGSLIASISYNFIINMNCEKTLSQAQQEYTDLYHSNELPIYGTKWKNLADEPDRSEFINYTTELNQFISLHGGRLIRELNDNGEISLLPVERLFLRRTHDTLPRNSYIQIVDSANQAFYFIPIE